MPHPLDLETLEARIIRAERRQEKLELQLTKLGEEELIVQQRLSEIPEERAKLLTKLNKQVDKTNNKKIAAYDLLKTQLAAGTSKAPVQPAHGRKRKRERSSSDCGSVVSDPDSYIEESEALKEAEAVLSVKRKPSSIRVRALRYTTTTVLTRIRRFVITTRQSMSDHPRRLRKSRLRMSSGESPQHQDLPPVRYL
jgi:hypothetical protein